MPIPDLTKATQDVIGASIVAGSNVTATYSETAGTVTIASSGGGGGTRETFMDCQVWYVDGTGGNNANSGLIGSPKQTIAATIAAAGDTSPVLIRCSNITTVNLVNVRRHNRLHIMPADLASPPTLTVVELSGCRAVDVRGFNVQQAMGFGGIDNHYGNPVMASVDCVFAGNKVGPYTGAPHWAGIQVQNQSHNVVIANNEITGLIPASGTRGVQGINVYGTGSPEGPVGGGSSMGWNNTDLTIVGNYIHDITSDGVVALGYMGGFRAENNFITDCHRLPGGGEHVDGFQVGGGPNMVFRNNAIWDTPGSGGGIFIKENYNNPGLLIENNTCYNMKNDSGTNQAGNGITLYNCDGARIWNNICWKSMGMTTPASSQGGGLWMFGGLEFQDAPNNELKPSSKATGLVVYRNILDKIRFEGGAAASYRNNNWINDPNGNGSQGYSAAAGDITAGVGTGISTTVLENLCIYRTSGRLTREWRRNPFAFWAGAPGLNS